MAYTEFRFLQLVQDLRSGDVRHRQHHSCTACTSSQASANSYSPTGVNTCTACSANTGSSAASGGCHTSTGYHFSISSKRFPSSAMSGGTSTMVGETFVASASSTVSSGNPEDYPIIILSSSKLPWAMHLRIGQQLETQAHTLRPTL